MTSLFLYGFNGPEAIAVIDGLRYRDRNLQISFAESGIDNLNSVDATRQDAVALVWCIDASVPFPVRISNQIAARGMPVVAIVDQSSAEGFDFKSGNIELCFNYASAGELMARIRTVKLRASTHAQPTIVRGDLTIDVNSFAVSKNGRNIELTYKEYELLKLFASNPGRVFRREDILNRIWGDDYYGGTRTVDVHVRRLRSKLDDVSHDIIETMWRVGYRFSTSDMRANGSSDSTKATVSVT